MHLQLIQLSLHNGGPTIIQTTGVIMLYDIEGLPFKGDHLLNLSISYPFDIASENTFY